MKLQIKKIHLIRKVDTFKSNWLLWECEAELKDGTVVNGFVQGDHFGELVDNDSFEPEE
jgi:hypothetical protein